jgi:hypothetical protein
MKAMTGYGETAERQADAQARRELLAAMARETGNSDATAQRPETTAALVALLAEHGLRRDPENDGLRRALDRARNRQARAASGGAAARTWLRASDHSFARTAGLANIATVASAVRATCHDGAEARFVGLLSATLASHYRSEDIESFLATHDRVTETAAHEDAVRRIPRPREHTRLVHRIAPARRPVSVIAHRRPKTRREDPERVLR